MIHYSIFRSTKHGLESFSTYMTGSLTMYVVSGGHWVCSLRQGRNQGVKGGNASPEDLLGGAPLSHGGDLGEQ